MNLLKTASMPKNVPWPAVAGCFLGLLTGFLFREWGQVLGTGANCGQLARVQPIHVGMTGGDRGTAKSLGMGTLSCHEQDMQMALEVLQTNIAKRETYISPWQKSHIGNLDRVGLTELLEYWIPVYPCPHEVRIGDIGEGGKWVCNPYMLNSKSVIYSVGSYASTDFEEDAFAQTGAEIHVFDCTLTAEQTRKVKSLSHIFTFHDLCIGPETNKANKHVSMVDIMSTLGHTSIDILKIDCESCEYTSFKEVFKQHGGVPIVQFLVETHNGGGSKIDDHKIIDTLFRELELGGLRMFHMEPNWRYWPAGCEWAFVNPHFLK